MQWQFIVNFKYVLKFYENPLRSPGFTKSMTNLIAVYGFSGGLEIPILLSTIWLDEVVSRTAISEGFETYPLRRPYG